MRKKTITENPKATAAKERKRAAQEEKQALKERELEDAKWIEHDKQILKKQLKKELEERKKLEQLKRKADAKALLDTEMASIESMLKTQLTKVTRAELSINASAEEKPKDLLQENLNRVQPEHQEARTVDQALEILNDKPASIDKHPERRMKAAYAAYEERRMQELKVTNPSLRASQLKQVIYKEWQKSPENPYNKVHQTSCKSFYVKKHRLNNCC